MWCASSKSDPPSSFAEQAHDHTFRQGFGLKFLPLSMLQKRRLLPMPSRWSFAKPRHFSGPAAGTGVGVEIAKIKVGGHVLSGFSNQTNQSI